MFRTPFAGVLLAVLAVARPSGAAPLSVSPVLMSFDAKPGQRAMQRVRFATAAETSHRVELAVSDLAIGDDGSRDFPPLGSREDGCSTWLVTPPETLTVAGTAGTWIDVVAKVPPTAGPGSYSCAIVAMPVEASGPAAAPAKKARGKAVSLGLKLGVGLVVVINVLGASGDRATQFDIVDATLAVPTPSTPLTVRVKLASGSSYFARPSGTLAVLDSKGKPVGSVTGAPVSLFPRHAAWMEFRFPDTFPPDTYRLVTTVADGFGGSATAEFQHEFGVPPPKATRGKPR